MAYAQKARTEIAWHVLLGLLSSLLALAHGQQMWTPVLNRAPVSGSWRDVLGKAQPGDTFGAMDRVGGRLA